MARLASVFALAACLVALPAGAQPTDPPPPPDAPAAPAPAPAPPAAPAPAPSAAPAPAAAPAAQPGTAPAPATPPGAAPAAAPPAGAAPGAEEPPLPGQDPNLPPLDYSAPPPPPPEKPDGGFEMPPWSLRVDPFNWLLEGRLGFELEVGLLKFMTFEVVPVFVANDKPPTLNFRGSGDIYQASNGLGPIAGATVDLGFWLEGKALRGNVIRLGMTNFGYEYTTKDDAGTIDSVEVTEREVFFMFGSASRWGAFTISGGIGLGLHLKKQQRCFPKGATTVSQATDKDCDNQLLISRNRDVTQEDFVDLNGWLFPADLFGRFSLGVSFD